MSFVHTHLHTSASTLDSTGSVYEYAKLAKKFGMSAIGITDHGNMSNVYNFCINVKKEGIKPIPGCEFYMYNDFIFKDHEGKGCPTSHQIVLVKNKQGFINANRLNYNSFTKYFYRKGLIKRSELYEFHEGLIITTSCVISEINQLFGKDKDQDAIHILNECKDVFKDDFYVEIQMNELDNQKKINNKLIKWAEISNTKIVLAGDVHYTQKDDARLQDLVIAIKRNSDPESDDFWRVNARHLFFQDRDDFLKFNKEFGYNYNEKFIHQCLDNTLEINDKCNFELELGKQNFPLYKVETEETKQEFFQRIIKQGLKKKIDEKKIKKSDMKEYLDRIKYEYDILNDKGYIDYMLIIWDMIDYAKRNNILVGSGRGSAAGSLISYLVGITDIDPIINDLYFERFLNPQRITNPDIDFDVESERRYELEDYLKNKYGEDHVTKVITFGTYQVKGVFRDLARVLNRNKNEVDFICKTIPEYNHDIKKWNVYDVLNFAKETIKNNDPIRNKFENWEKENSDLIYYANRLLNNIRHYGTHAGGIVVTPGPIWEYMPVNRIHGEIVSGFEESWTNKALSEMGILKIDALGLNTLTLFKYTIQLIKERTGKDITEKLNNIDINDKVLINDFSKAENVGVFQFESPGVSKLIKKVKPDCWDDIVAINALNRPATLGNGMAFRYAEWKNDPNKIDLPHPILKKYLERTHGILVYQETLIYILSKLAGYTYAEADIGRKLLDRGKEEDKYKQYTNKLKEDIKKHNNFKDADVEKIVEWIESYSGYSFNRSHSCAYAYLALQTLFLKNYYPLEYYTSLLTLCSADDVAHYLRIIKNKGIEIRLIDINKSNFNFKLEDNAIRIGFKVVKSFGTKSWDEVIKTRPYNSVEEFFGAKIAWGKLNRRVVESLIRVGAFDSLEMNRNRLLYWLNNGKKVDRTINLPDMNQKEKESDYADITGISDFTISDLSKAGFKRATEWEAKEEFVYGRIEDVAQKMTKNNKPYYVVRLNDGAGYVSFVVWNNKWKENIFNKGNVILAQLDKNDFGYNLFGECFVYEKA
jgi:DNA polymerase-3 subunit alpha